MKSITVNFCVREPKTYLNYHPSSFKVSTENFTNQIVEEVKSLSKKQRKSYVKIVKLFIATTISYLKLPSVSMANALNQPTEQMVMTGIPQDLIQPIMELIGMALGGSVLLSILLLIAAGTMRQFRKKKEAVAWIEDILKGFMQVMISVPLIFLLYYIVTKLLGNFSQFLSPF